MKIGTPLLLIVMLAGVSSAGVPQKAPLADYSPLWKKSVFTTPPSAPAAIHFRVVPAANGNLPPH